MPNLSSLAKPIPFLDAYEEQKRYNEQSGMRNLQEQSALMAIQEKMKARQDEKQLQTMFQQSGGDLEAVVQGALKAGRPDIAAKLAPLIAAQRRAAPEPRVVSPGGAMVDQSGKVIYQAPFKPDAPQKPEAEPADVRMVNFYHSLPAGDPRKAILKQIIDEKTRVPEKTFPIVTSGDGIFERRPEGLIQLKDPKTGQPLRPTARERPITEYQGKNALYGTRALQSHNILNKIEEDINTAVLASKQEIQSYPVIGGPLGAAANLMLTEDQQSVEQAQRNFVNAVLRQESGAVISEAEFENAKKQYFPAPGDGKQVIEQKRRNRVTAIEGFKKIAGPAWDESAAVGKSPEDIMKLADEIINGKP